MPSYENPCDFLGLFCDLLGSRFGLAAPILVQRLSQRLLVGGLVARQALLAKFKGACVITAQFVLCTHAAQVMIE